MQLMDAPLSSPSAAAPPQTPSSDSAACMVLASSPNVSTPPPPPPPAAPAPTSASFPSPSLQAAWPRSAQAALIALLGLAAILLSLQAVRSTTWGSRPTSLERGAGLDYRIDLNRASLAELMQMPGVGEARARKIVEYRNGVGAFRTVSDLLLVPGFGPATFERLEPWVCVDTDEADEEDAPPPRAEKPRRAVRKKVAIVDKALPGPSKKAAALKEKIDINRASVDELQKLPRVGAATARRIVEERAKARFTSVDDLARVRGIKAKTLDLLRPFIKVEGGAVRVAKAE
jgi:competence protein ComEA